MGLFVARGAPFTGSGSAPRVFLGRSRAMLIHLPPNEILFALLLATILMFVAAGVDLPPEDEPP